MTRVSSFARELTEEVIGGSPFKIGDVIQTDAGYKVKIVNGRYWGTFGLSNFWYWRKVTPSGDLGKVLYCGYGYVTDDGHLIIKDNQKKA